MKTASRLSLVLSVVALVAGLIGPAASTASAQCLGPDDLDVGPCCAQTIPTLPAFPSAQIPALGICWDTCTVVGQQDLRVQWTPPTQPFCGEYVTQLTVDDPATGTPVLTGTLTLDYTRTWIESTTAGVATQVWRFVAKADLSAIPGVPPPACVVPSCIQPIGPHRTAFYYGYVDYSSCSAAGPWENVLVLYHACDKFVHTAGFSDRPGVFHPTGAYAIVAPHSTLQPFVPANNFAPGGPLVAEATRNVDTSTSPSLCVIEDRVVSGDIQPLGWGCFCPFSSVPKHQTARVFKGQTVCVNAAGIPGSWTSLNILFPTLPWYHMVTTSIGCWGNPGVYPGDECAWVDEGLFITRDACTGDFIEIKYGGTTAKGFTVVPTWSNVTQTFTDLADNYSAPLSGPHPLPIYGSVRPTDHLIYVNVP